MLPQLLNPRPLPHASEDARERAFFNEVVTICEQSSNSFKDWLDHQNLPAARYPILGTGRQVSEFETTRDYTDKIELQGYYPRLHSGLYARVTDRTGEQVFYEVKDIDTNGGYANTVLLCKRRGVDLV